MKFKDKVYQVVRKIKRGNVLSYKGVAGLTGNPRAYRAVGNILNKNSDMKNIPCHRVVKSDGRIGGYKYGTKKKVALLKKEGVLIQNQRIVH